jgi:hypothetical protein
VHYEAAVPLSGNGGRRAAAHEAQTLVLQGLGEVGAHFFIKAAQHRLTAAEERYLHPQGVKHAGKLHPDVAGADDDHPARQGGQAQDLVRGHRVLAAGDRRADRVVAGGDEDIRRRQLLVAVFPLHDHCVGVA